MNNRVILYADTFDLVTNDHASVINDLVTLHDADTFDELIIYVADSVTEKLSITDKEKMLTMVLAGRVQFTIVPCKNLKIIKPIKHLLEDGNKILYVITAKAENSFVKNALQGLPTKVVSHDDNIPISKVEESIINNNYTEFCELTPKELHGEFQYLKNCYSNIVSEDKMVKGKIKKSEMDAYISNKIDEELENMAKSYKETLEKGDAEEYVLVEDLDKVIKEILNEKLIGKAYDKMFELKTKTLKGLKKIVKGNWIHSVVLIESKNPGDFRMKLNGAGNTVINIIWGKSFEGKFHIINKTNVVAGNDYVLKIQKFIMGLLENADTICEILVSVGAIADTMRIDNEIEDEGENDDDGLNTISSVDDAIGANGFNQEEPVNPTNLVPNMDNNTHTTEPVAPIETPIPTRPMEEPVVPTPEELFAGANKELVGGQDNVPEKEKLKKEIV